MTTRLLLVLLATTFWITACTSALTGQHVPIELSPSVGVPYYLGRPMFEIERKTLVADKEGTPVYQLMVKTEPDPNRRFEVGLKRGWFTSETFDLEVAPNGLLQSLNAKRTDESVAILAGLVGVAAKTFAAAAGALSKPNRTTALIDPAKKENIISEIEYNKYGCRESSVPNAINCTNGKFSDEELIPFLTKIRDKYHVKVIEDLVKTLEELTEQPVRAEDSKIVQQEIEVSAAFLNIQELDDWINELPPPAATKSPEEILADLQEAVQKELAKALGTEPVPTALPTELTAALNNLKNAIELVLLADEKVHSGGLGDRHKTLLAFLKSPLPSAPTADYAKAYAKLAQELTAVQTAIQALLPSSPSAATPETPLHRGTDVTSVIDENIYIDSQPTLSSKSRPTRIQLATARVKYGTAEAVVIMAPLASQPNEAKSAQTEPAQSSATRPPNSDSVLGKPGTIPTHPFPKKGGVQ